MDFLPFIQETYYPLLDFQIQLTIRTFSPSNHIMAHKEGNKMSSYNKVGIFGGDKRHEYMATSLLDKGYSVSTYMLQDIVTLKNHTMVESFDTLIKLNKVLIGSMAMSSHPLSKQDHAFITQMLTKDHLLIAGNIPEDIIDLCRKKEAFCYDLMKCDSIAIINAIATAEGTIMEAIKSSDSNLHGSNCLVLGYGRCGKVLAAKLKGLDANVTIAARREDALAYAKAAGHSTIIINEMRSAISTFQFIFNTIPSLIIGPEYLDRVSADVLIIDIASAPGGVDFDYTTSQGINAKLCLGLPGKVAPKDSASILVNKIEALIKERSG